VSTAPPQWPPGSTPGSGSPSSPRCAAAPAAIYTTRPKAAPGNHSTDAHDRVRHDIIDTTGCVTLRHAGRLYHIGIGRTHTRTHVLLLIQDLHVRVIHAATGELLRDLTLDPERTTSPPGGHPDPRPAPRATPDNPGGRWWSLALLNSQSTAVLTARRRAGCCTCCCTPDALKASDLQEDLRVQDSPPRSR
jgi:hypothetical protein